ncbi:MAG: hypothetical protein EBT03_13125 [Betaproteobacteria bacterium]|nr:hypothetical protein [Betaproteobacteria bacterium]
MANNIAFQAMGKTYKIACPTANTAVTIAITADSPVQQYAVACHTDASKPIYFRISTTNVAAVLPTATGEYSQLLPPSSRVIVTGPQCSNTTTVYVSAISESNNGEMYVTPGEGL